MSYLLDTDLCVAILRGRPKRPRREVGNRRAQGARLSISSISILELVFGALRSASPERNMEAIARLLTDLEIEDFASADARAAAHQRLQLASRGTPIGPYDLLIAGQALARDLTLVTGNTREFGRIEGLRVEDWLHG